MADEYVDIEVRLRQMSKFVNDSKVAAESVSKIGTASKKASEETIVAARRVPGVVGLIGRAAHASAVGITASARTSVTALSTIGTAAKLASDKVMTGVGRMRKTLSKPFSSLSGGVKSLIGGAVIFGGLSAAKDAVKTTEELAVQSSALHKVMGMSNQDSIAWIALAQAHGVSTAKLAMAFKATALQVTAAGQKSKPSLRIFKDLGITQDELASKSGNMNDVMMLVLDRLAKMPPGTKKTNDATKLLGRSWMQLNPLLGEGSKNLKEQMALAKAYGITLGGDASKNALKLHDAQIKLKLAGIGLQIEFTQYILPAVMWLIQKGLALYHVLRDDMGPAFKFVTDKVKIIVGWLKTHKTVLDVLLVVLKTVAGIVAAAFVIDKIAKFGGAVWGLIKPMGKVIMWIWKMAAGTTAADTEMVAANAGAATSFDVLAASAKGAWVALAPLLGALGIGAAGTAAGVGLARIISGDSNPSTQINPGASPNNPLPNSPLNGVDIGPVHIGGPGGSLLNKLGIGAAGALISRPTLALLGDKGPEEIRPLNKMPGAKPIQQLNRSGGGFKLPDSVLVIDRREIARVAGRYVGDREARQ